MVQPGCIRNAGIRTVRDAFVIGCRWNLRDGLLFAAAFPNRKPRPRSLTPFPPLSPGGQGTSGDMR